ncbi:GDSL family lipase [Paenibacillus sp. Marseille-P2973]|uniref:SGNH/GDSL hydrolase family protein n=1 Tax=Paenibacillus sp. Marseille-P2973 TaxID=1871032 RepID=UPI001B36EA48|nr:SGNH/GDSL hydrolase family protein [Paenibacillus sp. Marseille-P2973]MBQ4899873.1 GDSL family lipase [Paenibacillus sp. Marseille-P2973]
MSEAAQVFRATENHVKIIGRTYEHNDVLWLALSGGGVEFSFYGKKAEITIEGDPIATSGNNEARIGIYVNGNRVIDDMVKQPVKKYTAYESNTDQNVTIKVIKLSEAAMSTVGIQEITVDAKEGIKPAPANVHKIEFIGDSITCGYGVDDDNVSGTFTTATEDVTKTYAYLAAQQLQADYSMVSFSGYGIISGYTENGEKLLTHLVPDYYEKVGKSEGKFDGTLVPQSLSWDFNKFVPDLIVVNLGTNDDTYTEDDPDKQADYVKQYVEFLKMIRSNNPESTLLCTLGIMRDRLYPFVDQAAKDYMEETGDTKISAMRFDLQSEADGYVVNFHPSEVTHRKAAEKLVAEIKEVMGWE